MLKILADREINTVAEHFSALGSLRLFDGRALDAATLADAEVLLVRSVSKVDGALLRDSGVRFVGTATAGVDHIELPALERAGIAFSDAAGCNARPVAEHVITCLYLHAARVGCAPRDLSVGIIGCGHVGRSLIALLDGLGIKHVDFDPPRAARDAGFVSATLAEVLTCAVVSLHVPLIADGPWPTVNLLDAAAIAALKPDTLVINAARGGIVDEAALVARLRGAHALHAAIDCWAGEPRVDTQLLDASWLATPHLAGHSFEARLLATRTLWQAVRAWQGLPAAAPPVTLPALKVERSVPAHGGVAALLASVYPIGAHDVRMRAALAVDANHVGAHFDEIRRRHALRREIAAYSVACAGLAPDTVAELTALGFHCV
ncbi:MAG: 4-phosphoerythronate dehydrogenase [Gammaproteobacteria bacterium]|nr:4-phosphoerythronate dehydrogenase [Gammaproteobacteria bacterium]